MKYFLLVIVMALACIITTVTRADDGSVRPCEGFDKVVPGNCTTYQNEIKKRHQDRVDLEKTKEKSKKHLANRASK